MLFLKNWLPPIIWACLIFCSSSLSVSQAPIFPYQDKVIHICIYAVFGFFVMRAFGRAHDISRRRAFILSVIICTVFGALDEFHQKFVPMRSVEFLDVVSDLIGAVSGSVIYVCKPCNSEKR